MTLLTFLQTVSGGGPPPTPTPTLGEEAVPGTNVSISMDNRFITGSVTAGSETSAHPAASLQNEDPGDAWQTAASVTSWAEVDAGATALVNYVGIFRTNLTESALWRVRLSSSPALGDVYDSGLVSARIRAGYQQAVMMFLPAHSARYCRIDISDPGNPDGFLRVALAGMGRCFYPRVNFIHDWPLGFEDSNTLTRLRSGGIVRSIGGHWRTIENQFAALDDSEAMLSALELDRLSRLGGNYLVNPLPGTDYETVAAVYGLLFCEAGRRSFNNRWTWRLRCEERI